LTGGRFVETDDAYVKATRVTISPEVSGTIVEIAVRENAQVAMDDVLFRLDDRPFRAALDKAEAQLRTTYGDIESLKASYREKEESLQLAQTTEAYSEKEYRRQSTLLQQGAVPAQKLDDTRHNLDVARQQIAINREQLSQIRARLDGDPSLPTEQMSAYKEAKAMRDTAALNLEHTVVKAPFAGIASQVPDPGQFVSAGGAVMSVVAARNVWVEANFKETDLTYVQPGQHVEIHVDTYPDHIWSGHVESVSQATGAEFSVIPPQNATGNWVKVVQRIPVRIAVEARENDPVLRTGMSTAVEIDTQRQRAMPEWTRAVLSWFDTRAAATEIGGAS
jgi:membrane fusion protein (multidrug efflux system)